MTTQHALKPGYHIFYVNIHFAQDMYIGRFTRYDMKFCIAQNKAHAESMMRNHLEGKGVVLKSLEAKLEQNQNILSYGFRDRYLGFADGCIHEEYPASRFNKEFVTKIAKSALGLTSKPYNPGSPQLDVMREFCKQWRMVWGSLGFWCGVSKMFQQQGLDVLDQIIRGEKTLIDESERLYSLAGLFNQTYSYAVNYKE